MAVLYTTVPYAWRRHLSLVRIVLAVAGFLLYILEPARYSAPLLVVIGGYLAFATYTQIASAGEPSSYSVLQLALDTLYLGVCALHNGPTASWLTTVVYFHVLLFGTLLHTWKHVTALVVACSLLLTITGSKAATYWPAMFVGGVLALIFALYKDHLHERLSAALKRSVLSRSEAEIAREQERQRIAADFHDGPLQSFISFQMRLEIIRKLMGRDAEAAMRELLQLQDLGRSQVTELRAFVRGMQPVEITPETLGSAIREVVEHFERDSGISAQLFCADLTALGDTTAMEVLQIVREALNNVRKHSKASRVNIVVEAGERDVEIAVEDDGSGFAFSGAYTLDELEVLRLGPRSIKRRVRTLGGDLTVDSRPSSGATLRIRIPGNR